MPSRKTISDVKIYQNLVTEYLSRILGPDNVKKEWDVAKDSQDAFTRELYCPILDIAVGPFNINGRVEENKQQIEDVVRAKRGFINDILSASESRSVHIDEFLQKKNQNPRCFLAIEIEKTGSRKHMLGNIVNASIIGAFGIIIPFDDKALTAYKRIDNYIAFAEKVKKTRDIFKNVLIIEKGSFIRCLEDNSKNLQSRS